MNQKYIEPFNSGDFHFNGCHVFSENKQNFLLSSNGCVIILDDELLSEIQTQNLSDNLKLKLIQHNLATVPGKCSFVCRKEIKVQYFIIDLTKKCNFNCIYCFRNLYDEKTISIETLSDILNFIVGYCHAEGIKRIGLQMWGGEPLAAFDRIEYTIEYFKTTDIKISVDIETNASLVTDEIAEKLYRMGVNIGVSLDGTPELQNIQRKTVLGKPSADKVESGIKILQKYYGSNIGGITVVTRYNFRFVKEMLNYFIYTLHLNAMKFNLVRDNNHAAEHNLALSIEETEWFANELMDYIQAYKNLGADFSEGNIEVRTQNLLKRNQSSCCMSCGCQAGRKIISFDQKGDIFPCEMTDFQEEKLGSIYTDKSLNQMISESISKNTFFIPKHDEECDSCPWWCYCGGGCSSRNRYLGICGQIDKNECTLNKVFYPRLIQGILNKTIN